MGIDMGQVTENRCAGLAGGMGGGARAMRRELGDPVFDAWIGPLTAGIL